MDDKGPVPGGREPSATRGVMNWQRAHWIAGIVTLVVFPLTGAYMRWIAGVPELDDVTRAVFRSRHLILLLAAVINLALALAPRTHKLASLAALVAPALFLVAFAVEPPQGIEGGPLSQVAMYLLFLAGVALAWQGRR
jgi:hypothetical protein